MDGEAIKGWRKAHRLTLREMAERLGGVALTTVAAWESGRQRPAPYIDRALRDLARELAAEVHPQNAETPENAETPAPPLTTERQGGC